MAFHSVNGCYQYCMAVFTQISPLPAPSLSYSLTNDLFSLSVCRDAKYRQRRRKKGKEKKAIKGSAKANADDRKEMGSTLIAHTHQGRLLSHQISAATHQQHKADCAA